MKDLVTTKKVLINTTAPAVRRTLLNTRDRAIDLWARSRSLTRQGVLPNFLIIGTQKGGTTFLYDELVKHPQVMASLTKEVHFFDSNFDKGIDWYRAFFPTAEALAQHNAITGEASPSYLFHPHVAKRVHALLPNVKLILLLRNPVARAYSHYHHEVRLGYETLPFGEAIACEQERLDGEYARMLADEQYYSVPYMHYSYLTRGHYVEQLEQWYTHFPQAQILPLKSEDFYTNPAGVLQQVYTFLGLPLLPQSQKSQHKAFAYSKIDNTLQNRLGTYFAAHNTRLYEYLDLHYGW